MGHPTAWHLQQVKAARRSHGKRIAAFIKTNLSSKISDAFELGKAMGDASSEIRGVQAWTKKAKSLLSGSGTSKATMELASKVLGLGTLDEFFKAFDEWGAPSKSFGTTAARRRFIRGEDDTWELEPGTKLSTTDGSSYIIVERKKEGVQRGNSYLATKGNGPKSTKVFVKTLKLPCKMSAAAIKALCEKYQRTINRERDSLSLLEGIDNVATFLGNGHAQLRLPMTAPIDVPFIVQKWVDGRPFVDYLKAEFGHRTAGFKGIQKPNEYVRIAKCLINTFGDVHRRGVVHADLRPANLMELRGTPHVIDFGESFLIRDDPYGRSVPSGVPQKEDPYVAPERHHDPEAPWETPADRYSLGGCLYYFATGNEPPTTISNNHQLKDKIFHDIRTANSKLLSWNPGIGDAIIQCLHSDPNQRVAHTEDLARLLDAFEIAAGRQENEGLKRALAAARKGLDNAIDAIDGSNNPLFQRLLAHDLTYLVQKTEEMAKAQRAEIAGPRDAVILGLLHYLAELKRGDRYLTATIPSFWRDDNLGPGGRFLRLNDFLARNGVIIRRVFLVTECDVRQNDPPVENILLIHKAVLDQIADDRRDDIPIDDPTLDDGKGFYAGYIVMPEAERRLIIRDGYHVGLISKDGGDSVSLSFREDRKGMVRRIYVRSIDAQALKNATSLSESPSPNSISAKIAKMRGLLARSRPLSKYQTGDLEREFLRLEEEGILCRPGNKTS